MDLHTWHSGTLCNEYVRFYRRGNKQNGDGGIQRHIDGNQTGSRGRYVIAYVPSQLLAFGYVWFTGLREALAKTAYRDIWINFTGLFIVFCIIHTVSGIRKEKKNHSVRCTY